MDFIPSLRVRNVFDNMFQPDQTIPATQPQPDNSNVNQANAIIASLLNSSHNAQDQLNQQLSTVPNRANYKPSRATSIMARLGGLSAAGPQTYHDGQALGYRGMGKEGLQIIDSRLDKGYNDALNDWGLKLKPLAELADSERADNTNRRLMAATLLRDQQATNKLDVTKRGQDIGLQKTTETLAQRDRFLAYKYYTQMHPNHVIKADAQGNLIGIDPQTGQADPILDDSGKPVKSDKLPDLQKIHEQTQADLQKIGARGSQTRQNIAAEGAKEKNVEAAKQPNRIALKTTQSGGSAGFGSKTSKDVTYHTVVDPKGNHYNIDAAKVADFLKQNPDWKVVK